MRRHAAWVLCIPLLLVAWASAWADDGPGSTASFDVPMSCAALALIRGADYPEAVDGYDDDHLPGTFEEAERAALRLMWRHRQSFAEQAAAAGFAELYGRPPAGEELSNERARWVHILMDYPEPLHAAIAATCAALFDVADRSCPTPSGAQP